MSKKAKEVVEAAPKFKQPWQGFLSFSAIIILAYVSYEWFFNPFWGLFTKMVQSNAFVVYTYFLNSWGRADIGLAYALNNPTLTDLYPNGYLINWSSFFVLGIIWFLSIAVLARPFTPSTSRMRKQPWSGIILLILSLVLAFITWYILTQVFKLSSFDVVTLGTMGFWIFPIWATLFNYWPFIPRRPGTHALIRGTIFIIISWVIAFILRWIFESRVWGNSFMTVAQQYAIGIGNPFATYLFVYPLTTLQPSEPYFFAISLFLSLIVGNTTISVLNLFPSMTQPKRGIVNFMIAIIFGLILWGILVALIAPSYSSIVFSYTGPPPYTILLSYPYTNHAAIAAYLAFPLVTLLAGQLTFEMWPWSRWTKNGNLLFVILAYIIGTILFVIFMVSPGYASSITGANLFTSVSGLQTIYLQYWYLSLLTSGNGLAVSTYVVFAAAFEGQGTLLAQQILFSWILTVVIFYLLIYEGFEHWPFK